jgi:NADPH-dependent 2,4-dienoyl-CoA reductase/sulfur reductase-like enzyme/peroxiredoxin family protein/rhodanese-related sulfurtransferase/TusA-related sulfurtransferase
MPKTIIIGGVAGGATTAARLRRLDESAEIIMFERGEHISYANCGLPYYLGGTIIQRDKLFVQTPETFHATLNIDVRVSSEVLAIDRAAKRVQVKKLPGGETYWESYDKLVLSPGAEPVRPPIPGLQDAAVFTLRNVADTDRIKAFIETKKPRRAVVVGAGFIGLEMAENLHNLGMKVTIVEMAAQVMIMLDAEMAAEVHQHFKVKGVECYLGDGVQSLSAANGRTSITLNSGRSLDAELVILSIGVRPDVELARAAGLNLGPAKGIKVNEWLQTSDPDIYAVGDAIEFPSPITGTSGITYLAGPANKQGRICADNIHGGKVSAYKGSIGTAVAKVFDLTVASTGASEKLLKREGIDFRSCIIHSSSHAGYYPGATALTLKLLFGPDGRILGAQSVGYEGVDKRIDMIAVLIRKQGTVQDLTEIEHAYAPPYSSAKDPVNVVGFIAQNLLSGKSRNLAWDQLAAAQEAGAVLVDVRLPEETQLGTIPGALNIPLQQLRQRADEIPRGKPVITYCGVGLRAYLAERILAQKGFADVRNLSGGYKTWEHAMGKQSNEDLFSSDTIWKDDNIYQANPERSPLAGGTMPAYIKTLEIDACGLQCPGPILKLKTEMDKLKPGDLLRETASDPGFVKDVEAWCRMTGNRLVSLEQKAGTFTALIEKGQPAPSGVRVHDSGNDTTLIVFSQDLDRALASLVIANGAASAGKRVTVFFTFWGLNVIKKVKKPRVKKDIMGRMFGLMLPSSLHKLHLSKLSMLGMGDWMMKKRMAALRIDNLQEMLDAAVKSGVRLVACNMSMDVMGVKAEELVDGVECGGVATMLDAADSSRATFFI